MRISSLVFSMLASVLLGAACGNMVTIGTRPDMGHSGPDLANPRVDPPACGNGMQDVGEADIDCGGDCPRCAAGKRCSMDDDCASSVCSMGVCQPPRCEDGRKNGDETGVDCGGITCMLRCPIGEGCRMNSDCSSNMCRAGVCVGPPGLALSFAAPVARKTEIYIHGMGVPAIGDFNGDAKLDVAAPNRWNNTVEVVLGRGDGTLEPPTVPPTGAYPTGPGPYSAVARDFNRDGLGDLVVLSDTSYVVMLANKKGFAPPVQSMFSPHGPMIDGDFDGDGNTDLAVATSDPMNGFVTLLLGNGKGQFPQKTDIKMPTRGWRLVAGDLNRDGKLDLVAWDAGPLLITTALLQSAKLTFGMSWTIQHMEEHGYLGLSDFDGDGFPDLARIAPSGLVTFTGDGKGAFSPPVPVAPETYHTNIVTADFNLDGNIDIAMAIAQPKPYGVGVYLGDGKGAFSARVTLPFGQAWPHTLAAADFNGDRKLDLLFYTPERPNSTGTIWIALNTSR